MVRWLAMFGTLGGLSGCGLIDLVLNNDKDDEESADSDFDGTGPDDDGPIRRSDTASPPSLLEQCELGAEAFCTCIDDGYVCGEEAFATLVQGCTQQIPEADFVLCYADQVENNTIDCQAAESACLGASDTGGGTPGY